MLCGWMCRGSLLGLPLAHGRPLGPGARLCTEEATERAQGVQATAWEGGSGLHEPNSSPSDCCV